MPGVVYTNYRQSLVITGGRLLRWKNCELIDTMPDNSVSASDIKRSNIVALTKALDTGSSPDADIPLRLEVLLPAGTNPEDIQRSGFVDTSLTPGFPA